MADLLGAELRLMMSGPCRGWTNRKRPRGVLQDDAVYPTSDVVKAEDCLDGPASS